MNDSCLCLYGRYNWTTSDFQPIALQYLKYETRYTHSHGHAAPYKLSNQSVEFSCVVCVKVSCCWCYCNECHSAKSV